MNQLVFKKFYMKYAFLSFSMLLISIILGILLSDVVIFLLGLIVAAFFCYPIYSYRKIEKSGDYTFRDGTVTMVQFHAKTSVVIPRKLSKDMKLGIKFNESDSINIIIPQLDYILFNRNQIYEGAAVRVYYKLDNELLFFDTLQEGNE